MMAGSPVKRHHDEHNDILTQGHGGGKRERWTDSRGNQEIALAGLHDELTMQMKLIAQREQELSYLA